ncbi:3-ketoacyl-ACP synthase [Rhodococcus ruber Chol-4]|uniref:3-ketoacyl-ACP synthase III n=1 Tax=Rhodococcus ruber TaxID=1830 RepID=A0A098BUR9_9NOCA|nr:MULTISPECIES: ketoacyl-ACP synthase III [Rhodococcus]RIK12679.1 MAG: ketoacyl-ACP synthase III [Acidobacteriota bacterium]ATQ31505.1 ketoacyl-ACP synthase III [Rhodococcus ruber]AWG98440.1 ketoacyl-ACP synthase III [Rhodococcus ruber]KXF88200.1 3-ketoacyl-ACP synthase [Rhodococcus ruber Chol-4]MBP2210781.1 3-oxoacyl-(acyl-carrier-protein) synthase III [Rhodococcus ruber]
MQPFETNRHGRIVFPSNFFPDIDFSTVTDVEQLDSVIRRDFDTKAPTASEILARHTRGDYRNKVELLRDVALNAYWANRFALTMFDKRPTRWADVPRTRDDLYMPVLTPWPDQESKVAEVEAAFRQLPAGWDDAAEDCIFETVFDVFAARKHVAGALPTVKPTVAQLTADPKNMTLRLGSYDPNFRVYSYDEILDCHEDVPALEALRRWSMVLHNQQPWDRKQVELVEVGQLRDDDYVVVFHPRDRHVQRFISRVTSGRTAPAPQRAAVEPVPPATPYPTIDVRRDFAVQPRIEALAVAHGDVVCTNEDLIRNSAYNWSAMTADEVTAKTGIEQRRYTSGSFSELALQAARAAVEKAQVGPADIGAVLVCTCTSDRLIPSLATYLSGELGIAQTHASFDLVAACAGLPYGLAEATRILQHIRRPVLVVCVEKFSDKIGSVRPSRMIFGDGAAALVVGVAPEGAEPDIEYLQTYASGPTSEVNSIIWPNPDFDNAITVYGPEVKSLAGRYLTQMLDEVRALPGLDESESLLDDIDLVVPHQANKTMIIDLAAKAGLAADRLYFNIEQVGNASSASIPLAIHDAVRDGVITEPVRIFAPGFGAGAVAGYSVMRIDPAVVAIAQ